MSDVARTQGASVVTAREGLSREVERRHETASAAVTAQARAEIEASYLIARNNRRDDDDVRTRLLAKCKNKSFAERAYYSLERRGAGPGRLTGVEGRVEGLSVRYAEEAIRVSGNIRQQTRTLYDDDVKRIVEVAVVDLETNAGYSRHLTIEKTIERRSTRDGQVVLGSRENSAGQTVYIIQSTDDETLQKESNLVSKTFRTLALRLVPPETLHDCEVEVIKTVRAAIAVDPEGERRKILDGFANLNVHPSDLKLYLGHDVAQCTPAQLEHLRGLYAAMREGEVTWPEVLAEKQGTTPAGGEAAAAPPKKSAGKTVAERVAKRVEEQARKNATPATPAAAPPAPAPKDLERLKDDVQGFKDLLTDALGNAKETAAVLENYTTWAKSAPKELVDELDRFIAELSEKGKKTP